ncbi:MAG: MinD/ParA family protein [Syntrophomonadaceae bacterium]|jgi:flagellar biosynthesis protein FlhG
MKADQAKRLRELVTAQKRGGTAPLHKTRIITVASGKGGAGKTSVAVNLAIALGKAGNQVAVLDADLGMANVDIMLGIIPRYTLSHVLQGRKKLEEIIIATDEGVQLIPGCSAIFGLANSSWDEKRENLVKEIKLYAQQMDFLIIDCGAGISETALSFMLAAQEVIVIITPEPTSITDGYGLIKVLSGYQEHPQIMLLINKVKNSAEAGNIANKIELAVKRFLDTSVIKLGYVRSDVSVDKSVREMTPFITKYPKCEAAKNIITIADNLAGKKGGQFSPSDNLAMKLARLMKTGMQM